MEDCHCTKRLDSWQGNGQKRHTESVVYCGALPSSLRPRIPDPRPPSLMAKTHLPTGSQAPSLPQTQEYTFPLLLDPGSQAPVLLPSDQGT